MEMDSKLLITTGVDQVAEDCSYRKRLQQELQRDQSHSALSEVDELLLRSDMVLQRSQQDFQRNPGSALNQNSSHSDAHNHMNSHNAIEVREQVSLEQPYGLAHYEQEEQEEEEHEQEEDEEMILVEEAPKQKAADMTTLEQELYSISQEVEEEEDGTESQPFTPPSQRRERLCKEMLHVQQSLHKQQYIEDELYEQLAVKNDRRLVDMQHELLQEPELIQNEINGTQDLRPQNNFAFNGSASYTQKLQESSQTQKLTTGKLDSSNKKRTSDPSNSLSRTRSRKKQNIRRLSHKKGCPAVASIEAAANRSMIKKHGPRSCEKQSKLQPKRSRNSRINERSNSNQGSRSRSQGSVAGLRASIVSKGSRRSQSMISGQSRSNSNQLRRSRQSRFTAGTKSIQKKPKKQCVADAACSPIRFDDSYQPNVQQQRTGQGRETMTITSSAAADVAFVGYTSYQSSINDPKHHQLPQSHFNSQPSKGKSVATDAILRRPKSSEEINSNSQQDQPYAAQNDSNQMNMNSALNSVHQQQQQPHNNQNLNIFYNFKNSESTITKHPSQHQIEPHGHKYEALVMNDSKRESTREAAGPSSERHMSIPGHRLSNQAIQCRQVQQDGQDTVSPKSKLKLNLNLLRKRQEQQQSKELQSSTKALIDVRPFTAHSNQPKNLKQAAKGPLARNTPKLNHYLQQCPSRLCPTSPDLQKSDKLPSTSKQNLEKPPKCAVCHMSASTVHPGVYKAQRRVKQRRFNESQNQLMQHLRNPMSIGKQLRKHLKLQRAVKSQFEQFVGQAGQLAIQSLNKAPSAQSFLRQQPNRALAKNSSRWSDNLLSKKRARSAQLGARFGGKKREIVKLRYAPHLVRSTNLTPGKDAPIGNARQPINIIVNERRVCADSRGSRGNQRSSSHSRSRHSGKGRSAVRLHRMLSSDAKRVYGSTKMTHKGRYADRVGTEDSAEHLIESTICSRSVPRRWNKRGGKSGSGLNHTRMSGQYSEHSSDPASSSQGRIRVFQSQSSNQDQRTANFHHADRQPQYQQQQQNCSQQIHHKKLNLAKKKVKQQKMSHSQSQDSVKPDRQARQWVRLSEILQDKELHKNMKSSKTDTIQTQEYHDNLEQRFETFNQQKKHHFSHADKKIDPVQSYDHDQSRSSKSKSQQKRSKSAQRSNSRSSARQHQQQIISAKMKKKKSQSRSSSRLQQLSASITPSPDVAIKDISRSASGLSNLSCRMQLASHLVSSPQAIARQSHQGLSQRDDDAMVNIIAQDKTGSLRFRLQKTKELVDTIERDEQELKARNRSPLQADSINKSSLTQDQQFSEPQPHHIFSHIDVQSASKGELDEIMSQGMEPCFGAQKENVEVIVERILDATPSDDMAVSKTTDMHPLQSKSPKTLNQQHIPQNLRQQPPKQHCVDKSGQQVGRNELCHQAERTFGNRRSLTQDQLLPRHKFMCEVSGVKYDYRPLPPREYNRDDSRYDRMYGQYGGPSPDLRYQYDPHGVALQQRAYAKSHQRSQRLGVPLMGPEEIQRYEYERLIQLQRDEVESPYARSGSHFRFKQRPDNSGSRSNQLRQASQTYKTRVQKQNGHYFNGTCGVVTEKNETLTKCDSKGNRSSHSRDSKHASLRRVYNPQQQNRAVIPKLKSFKDMASERKLRADYNRINQIKSIASSDLDEQEDFETTQKRLERISLCQKIRGGHRPLNKRDLCNGHRCSISKRSRSRSSNTGKLRVIRSKTRSRSRSHNQIATIMELKEKIKHLQRPTFSSKMHEYRRKRPDPNELGNSMHDKEERYEAEKEDDQQMMYCQRDGKYWQRQVEGLAQSFSSNVGGRRGRGAAQKQSMQRSKTDQLVPLKKLKELSKVMNQIMDIDQHVQQLKSSLAQTSEQLVRQIRHKQSAKQHQARQRYYAQQDDNEEYDDSY